MSMSRALQRQTTSLLGKSCNRRAAPILRLRSTYSVDQPKTQSRRLSSVHNRDHQQPQRTYASSARTTYSNENGASSPLRISYVFGVLLVIGMGATAFGVYDFYQALTMWPTEVRGDLRAGLRARERKDLQLSQRYLRRAWDTVRTLSSESLEPEPYLKVSGVAIVLAEVLEADNKLREAYDIYAEALEFVRPNINPSSSVDAPATALNSNASPDSSTPPVSPPSATPTTSRPANVHQTTLSHAEQMRTVVLALKLGDMALKFDLPPADEEGWLRYAVEEVIRMVQVDYNRSSEATKTPNTPSLTPSTESIIPSQDLQLPLPSWLTLTKLELAVPMERLADFYRRHRSYNYALQLYHNALTILMRGNPQEYTRSHALEGQCYCAQVMNNFSATCLECVQEWGDPEGHYTQSALQYAHQSAHTAQFTIEEARKSEELPSARLCAGAFVMAAYNMIKARTMLGDFSHLAEDEQRLSAAHATYLSAGGDPNDPEYQALKLEWKEMQRRWRKQASDNRNGDKQ